MNFESGEIEMLRWYVYSVQKQRKASDASIFKEALSVAPSNRIKQFTIKTILEFSVWFIPFGHT